MIKFCLIFQMFTQVYRQEIELDQKLKSEFSKIVDGLLRVSTNI